MNPSKMLRILIGPLLLLLLIYLIWTIRYPIWQMSTYVEPIFVTLILSYFLVLLFSLAFIKKDMKSPFHSVFQTHGYCMPMIGIGLAVLFQVIWFSIAFLVGGKFETRSFPSLSGYEAYSYYALVAAFSLYVTFAVFGAFAEEVAFRRYIQSKLTREFGLAVAIVIASLFFSLEHIQILNLTWIADFFQKQLIYVFLFGVFIGYFFFKSAEDLWSAFAFHGTMNIFNISFPIDLASAYVLQSLIATLTSFAILILLLHFGFKKNPGEPKM